MDALLRWLTDQSPVLQSIGVLIAIAGLILVAFGRARAAARQAWRAVRPFLPRPPERAISTLWQGKKRLRHETVQLVSDLHAYLKTKPSLLTDAVTSHQSTIEAMEAAASETEKNAIWRASTNQLVAQHEAERRELTEKFGGRVRYVLGEYLRRGLIAENEMHRIEWQIGSTHWAADAASSLDALARRL